MRVCGMMGLFWRKLQPCILLLMAVVPSITSRGGECPESDVKYKTNQCLSTYNSLPSQTFYTGIDVENIRFVCNELKKSMNCVIKLKDSCSQTSHSHIMTVVEGPIINVAELCHVENVYELYSRHQFCYSRVETASSSCYDEFDQRISPIKPRLSTNDPLVQKEYCRYFDQLTNCIQKNIQKNCGEEAASLTEKLVRATYGQSEPCHGEPATTSTHTPQTTLSELGRNPGSRGEQQGAPVGAASTSRLSLFAALLVLASAFIINTALLHR